MSYVNVFKDFNIKVSQYKKKVYMVVETSRQSRYDYNCESEFVRPPNFIERLFGVTWQDKLEMTEKKLFLILLKKVHRDPLVEKELEKFLKS